MAKKQTIKAGLFQKTSTPTLTTPTTTPTAATPTLQAEAFDMSDRRRRPAETKVKAISVSLTMLEYAEIDRVANSVGAKRMTVMNAALRHTMGLIRAGKLKVRSGIDGGRVVVYLE